MMMMTMMMMMMMMMPMKCQLTSNNCRVCVSKCGRHNLKSTQRLSRNSSQPMNFCHSAIITTRIQTQLVIPTTNKQPEYITFINNNLYFEEIS